MRKLGKQAKGFALVTAIAIALVCFLIVTVMVGLARIELQATVVKALDTQRYFAARGQVQELLHQINGGVPIDTLLQTPLVAEVTGFEVVTRVVPDASGTEGVYHLVAEIDDRRLAETTVHIGEPRGGGSFSGVLTDGPSYNNAWPHRFYSQSNFGAWMQLPAVPMEAHGSGGAVITATRVTKRYVADMQGHLIINTTAYDSDDQPLGIGLHRYGPEVGGGAGGWEPLGPVPKVVPLGGDSFDLDTSQSEITPLGENPQVYAGLTNLHFLTSHTFLAVTRSGTDFYDRINYGTSVLDRGCLFRRLDIPTGTWSLVTAPQDSRYRSDGSLVQQGRTGSVGFIAGGVDRGLVCISNNVVCRLDDPTSAPPAWDYLPPVPNHYYDQDGALLRHDGFAGHFGSLAVGESGEIYVGGFGEGGVMAISRYDGETWTPLRPPPDTPNWVVGGYLSVDGNGALLLESYHERDWYQRYDGEVWRKLPMVALDPGEMHDLVVGGASLTGEDGRVVKKVFR